MTVTKKSMSRQCSLCLRSSFKAVSRSHSNIATIHRQKANLQKKTLSGVKLLLCTSCMKTIKNKRPELFQKPAPKKAAKSPSKKK